MINQKSSRYIDRYIADYFLTEEKKGVRWAARVRIIAGLIILIFIILNSWGIQEVVSAETWYLTKIIMAGAAVFVALSIVQYFIAGRRFYLLYLKYVFASLDVAIILYVSIQVPIDIFYPFPTPILLKSGLSVLFFILLVTAALTFSPSLVLWTGVSILIGWGSALLLILSFKENFTYSDLVGRFDFSYLQEFTLPSDPYYIDIDRWRWDMIVVALVTFILALIVERSRRQILSQAKASFEKGVAEQSAEARAEFLATMSHEVRTPLNGIIGMTSLLSETLLNDQQKDYVQTMRFSGEALLSIVNDVLDLSKIEAGKLDFHLERFNLVELVQSGLVLFEQQLREKDLDYFIDIEANVPKYLIGDSFRLRQILLNLTSNAIKYTEEGVIGIQVSILARKEENVWLDFTVSDTGIGISILDQQKLFQRYGQAEKIDRQYGGTGLGLYICKKIVDVMDGRIRVESKPGEGSRFIVSIPFAVSDEQEEIKPDIAQSVSPLRILIADDNSINRKILQNHLKTQGHRVKAVTNGKEVLKTLEKETFDLLLLDLDMPIMDGYETVRKMHLKSEESYSLPVWAVTAGISEAKRKECFALGMKEVILKPIAFAFLDRLLERHAAEIANDDKDGL